MSTDIEQRGSVNESSGSTGNGSVLDPLDQVVSVNGERMSVRDVVRWYKFFRSICIRTSIALLVVSGLFAASSWWYVTHDFTRVVYVHDQKVGR